VLLPLTPKLIIKFQMNVCLNLMQKNKKKQKVVLIWVDSVPQEESPTADEKRPLKNSLYIY